ncbi:hypothetical protein F4805DRAFT_68742 [Annulohypoxylon moriforme]|nr:hypothetical protein F4805DRAFT_68742 [Annulohypoxylon moriforme]
MADYTGLEPTDVLADEQNVFDNVNFDESTLNEETAFTSFFDYPEQQVSESGPVMGEKANEVTDQSLPQCIDPKMLNNDHDATTDAAPQQQPLVNYGMNYPFADPMANLTNGNVIYNGPYPPVSNSTPFNFPHTAFQYPPSTNPAYLGHGAGYPVQNGNMYPVYVMQYPPPQSAYPAAEPTYVLPNGPPPTAQPITQPAPENHLQPQDLPPARNASFNSSSVDPRLAQSRHSRIPSPIIIYRKPPLKRPSKGPNGNPLKNDRIPRVTRKNQPKPNPREWYGPPLSPPDAWGPKDKYGRHVFKYTEFGELERGKTYSQKEMRWYLYGPKVHEDFELPKPLPNAPEVENKTRQGLTIWIGWVPPQSNERYPHGSQSQRCRFADCPDPNHTIRTGFPRVIFDERTNVDGEAIDPYHNAGYAHLYCFEKHFDLVQAFHYLDVRPDYRDFKREENLGKLSRQLPEVQNELDLWWRDQLPKFTNKGKNRDRSYEQSLSYRLICHSLEQSTEGRVKMRENRAGADMSKHKGDLTELMFLKDCMNEGLVDDHGDPIPGAREMLAELNSNTKGKRKKGTLKRLVASRVSMSQSPQSAHPSSYTPGFTPIGDFIPMPQSSPTGFSGPRDGLSTAATNFNQTIAAATMYQPRPEPQSPVPQKRDRDEVVSEDQQGGYSNIQGQPQEPPTRKRRLSSSECLELHPSTDEVPPPDDANQQPQIGRGDWLLANQELDGLPNDFPPLGAEMGVDEVDLDDVAVFEMIDASMPSGKSSNDDSIEVAVETEDDGTHDQELGEDDDLFGEPDDADITTGDSD